MKRLLLILSALPAFAASPATCYPAVSVTSITTIAAWNNAANWSSTSHGTASTCAATGGATTSWYGSTVTLNAGVPGAHNSGGTDIDDSIVVPVDSTIIWPASSGQVELGSATYPTCDDAFKIHATNSSTFGVLSVAANASMLVHGASSAGCNYGVVDQFAVFCLPPGASFWIGTDSNVPQLAISGRLHIGRGDQTAYPTPTSCGTTNAGALVTASVGFTLNFTAITSLPTGIAAGQKVELDPVQQTVGTYPYATGAWDGVTPPPFPPVMPTTSDEGTGVSLTCGDSAVVGVAACKVPESTELCVVAVSGTSVSLGWPRGGTPSVPYCTGAETAMAITAAGSGRLWLKIPAFFGGDPARMTYNTSQSVNLSGAICTSTTNCFDAVRSGYTIPNAPISNQAGTGPGRNGDNSLAVTWTLPSGLGTCSKLSVPDVVTGTDCYIDYSTGWLFAHASLPGSSLVWTTSGNMTYKSASAMVSQAGTVLIPAGSRTYNEMVFANAHVKNVFGTTSASVIQFSNLPNTANNKMGVTHTTTSNSLGEFGIYGTTGNDSSHPIEFNQNSFQPSAATASYSQSHIGVFSTSSYVDISANRVHDRRILLKCQDYNGLFASRQTFDNFTVTNNNAATDTLIGQDNYPSCSWTNRLVQQNRIQGSGTTAGYDGNYLFALYDGANYSTAGTNTNITRGNIIYGTFRGQQITSNSQLTYNTYLWNWHHVTTMNQPGYTYNGLYSAGYLYSDTVDHNIMASQSYQPLWCAQTGYDDVLQIDSFTFSNNTCVGFNGGGGAAGGGGFMWGDPDWSFSLITKAVVKDNVFAMTATNGGMTYTPGTNGGNMEQKTISLAANNGMQGSSTSYTGVSAPNNNGIPNATYNRNVTATQSGVNYNTSGSRNITGITVQNANFSASTVIALKYNWTNRSSVTVQMSSDAGSSYGTAAQLNWAAGGAGTSYTIAGAGVTDPGVLYDFLDVTTTGTPFNSSGAYGSSYVPATCPASRWAWMLTGANTGTAYGVVQCPGTYNAASSKLTFVPHTTGIAATDTFAALNSEVNVCDNAGTKCVDLGIDPRTLPTATVSPDLGITVVASDFCTVASPGCGTATVVTGLPTTFTAGTTGAPLVAVSLPEEGGSSEAAHNGGYYLPTGTTWKTSSTTGSYIGAVSPTLPPSASGGLVLTGGTSLK